MTSRTNHPFISDASRLCLRLAPSLLLAAVVAGCSGGTSTGITPSATPGTRAPSNSLLAQVRAAGQIGNELDIQPLRDPQVEDLRASAAQSENRGDYAGARRALAQALQLSANDPELLQRQAEMALAMRDWAGARQLANQSYDRGPKLGGLCRRNWMTIKLAAESSGDSAGGALAQQRLVACTVAPPTRM